MLNIKSSTNKRKILNDPLYGFVTVPGELAFDIINHPYFQRLRRILQLGFTNYVYPGANHNRFQHALGAMHLMTLAIDTLRQKGIEINADEAEGAIIAILCHDIGHGPFSHALEFSILSNVNHELVSLLIMKKLNDEFDGKLNTAIQIFEGSHSKKFLHQLVSSQLDMDRLDYLNRDSFFSGVHEGTIGWDRIIKMLNVVEDELVVEQKGIYSIEKFLISRRIMYWQVYLHKTVIAAEHIAVHIFKRAKELFANNEELFLTQPLKYFFEHEVNEHSFVNDAQVIKNFTELDDYDVFACIKAWCNNADFVLSYLSRAIVDRLLFKTEVRNTPFDETYVEAKKQEIQNKFSQLSNIQVNYFVFVVETANNAYEKQNDVINIVYKNGTVQEIGKAADLLNISVLAEPVVKYYLCYPKL